MIRKWLNAVLLILSMQSHQIHELFGQISFTPFYPEMSKDANYITMWHTIKDKASNHYSFRIKQKDLCTAKHACVCVVSEWVAVMSDQNEHFPHNLFSEQYSRSSAREFSKVFSNETGNEREGEMEDRK